MDGCRALRLHVAGMSWGQLGMRSGCRLRGRLDGSLTFTWAAGCIFVAQVKNHIYDRRHACTRQPVVRHCVGNSGQPKLAWPGSQDTACVRHLHAGQLSMVRSDLSVAGCHMCAQSSPCCSAQGGTGRPAPLPPPLPPAVMAGGKPPPPKVRCRSFASLLHIILLAARPDCGGHQTSGHIEICPNTHRQWGSEIVAAFMSVTWMPVSAASQFPSGAGSACCPACRPQPAWAGLLRAVCQRPAGSAGRCACDLVDSLP